MTTRLRACNAIYPVLKPDKIQFHIGLFRYPDQNCFHSMAIQTEMMWPYSFIHSVAESTTGFLSTMHMHLDTNPASSFELRVVR